MAIPLIGVIVEGVKAIAGIADEAFTNDEERAEGALRMQNASNDLRVNLAQLEAEFAEVQSRVVIAETQSQSILARNWRPLTMLVFVGIIFFNYIISPLFSLEALTIVPDMWALLKLGIGGYIGGRTVEKVAPKIVDAIRR